MESIDDNFVPVIEGYNLHSAEKPFCYDQTCPCHEDELLIEEVALLVQDGLMTPSEATDFVNGRGI